MTDTQKDLLPVMRHFAEAGGALRSARSVLDVTIYKLPEETRSKVFAACNELSAVIKRVGQIEEKIRIAATGEAK